jgi:hypothetical protein
MDTIRPMVENEDTDDKDYWEEEIKGKNKAKFLDAIVSENNKPSTSSDNISPAIKA